MANKKRFFLLEDEEERRNEKGKNKKIPDVIGQVTFSKRFQKTEYKKDLERTNQEDQLKSDLEIDHDDAIRRETKENNKSREKSSDDKIVSREGKDVSKGKYTKSDRRSGFDRGNGFVGNSGSGFGGNGGEKKGDTENNDADKRLVINVLPVTKAPKDRKRLEAQILYIGKMVGIESKLSINERTYGDLYDQNHKIINEFVKVKEISGEWERAEGRGKANSRHMILAIGEKIDKEKATAATKLFLEDVLKSKGFDYVWAGHFDTQNDHFHVVVKKRNNLGENLRFSKDDLFVMMQKYSEYLAMVGINRSIVARRDQKKVLKNVEEGTEHMKNDNSWYQAKLAKGNDKDFNAYNYKANLAGRIEEEIGVLQVKNFLEKELQNENKNIVNRLRKNIKNDGVESVLKSLSAVKQMRDKGLKIDSMDGLIVKAVENKFEPRAEKIKVSNEQKKVKIRDISDQVAMEKFKEAALEFHKDPRTRSDIIESMDSGMIKAFSNVGKKIYFGKTDKCEICWYGEAGYISDYRTGDVLKWGKNKIKDQGFEVTKEVNLEDLEKEMNILNEKNEKIKRENEEKISEKATKLFYSYMQKGQSGYLSKKSLDDVDFTNVRYTKEGILVVPLHDQEGKIWSLQYISEDSGKKFLKEGKKRENFFILRNSSQKIPFENEDKILLAEGFATAASINKATGYSVVVYFSASNIEGVVDSLAKKYSDKKLFILADNDLWKEKNVGREKAEQAILKYRESLDISMILPKFSLGHKDSLPTDFNDLHSLAGIDEVKNQIEKGFVEPDKLYLETKVVIERPTDIIKELRELKNEIVDLTDKREIKKKVDDLIKLASTIDKDLATNLDQKLNSDEVKYGYIQPKPEVKYKNKLKNTQF